MIVQGDILAMLADELDAARDQLEGLGASLMCDDAVVRRHMTELQALDHIGQRCMAIAAILRSEDLHRATGGASLESITGRLTALVEALANRAH